MVAWKNKCGLKLLEKERIVVVFASERRAHTTLGLIVILTASPSTEREETDDRE
jgi:hypothetical protein